MLQRTPKMSLAEFFAWEARQPADASFEFVDGEIVAFGQGASQEHNYLVTRLAALVHANEHDCRTFAGMQRLVVDETATYPDVMLACDERDLGAERRTEIRYPKLVLEVLSPSTAGIDLRGKRHAYAAIDTLVEYLVVDSQRRSVQLFRRIGATLAEIAQVSDGSIALESIGARLDVRALYDGVLPQ